MPNQSGSVAKTYVFCINYLIKIIFNYLLFDNYFNVESLLGTFHWFEIQVQE